MFTKKLYFGTDTIMRSNMGLRSYAAFSCLKFIYQREVNIHLITRRVHVLERQIKPIDMIVFICSHV